MDETKRMRVRLQLDPRRGRGLDVSHVRPLFGRDHDVRARERGVDQETEQRRLRASVELAIRAVHVVAEGRVYFTNDAGVTFVVKADGELDVLAKNALGEKIYASPAFSDGDIFHRGEKHLWCIGKK